MLDVFAQGQFKLSDLALLFKRSFTITAHTSTGWSVTIPSQDGSIIFVEINGSGFSLTGDKISSGTITSITLSDNLGHKLVQSNLSIPARTLSDQFGLRMDDNGDDHVRGGHGRDYLEGGLGNDRLDGGAGDDRLAGGASNDKLAGGAGTDTAVFDHARAAVRVDLTRGTATGEGHDTLRSIENVIGSRYGDTIGGNSGANRLDGAGGNDKLAGGAGADLLIGAAGQDRMAGGSGDDWLTGGGGKDTLAGGQGKDTLTGGGGRDTFVFDTPLSSAKHVDIILDFKPHQDKIALDHHIFTALAKTGGLSNEAFHAGAAAEDVSEHIIYNRGLGTLSYDADGDGPGKAVVFAILDNSAALSFHDILVV